MAKYLRQEILQEDDHGAFKCLWRSGLDAVPRGYRTYVSNTNERAWRTIKGILPHNYHSQDCSELMDKLGNILASWVGHAHFANLVVDGFDPLAMFATGTQRPSSERLDDGSQHKRP